MSFEVLRKKKAVEIMLILQSGAMGIREIQEAVGGSYSTIYPRLNELQEAGLIKEEYLNGELYGRIPPDKRWIRLTKKGRQTIQFMIRSNLVKPLSLPKVRERWIIAVLHTLGLVSGRTRLIKLLFLLKNELGFTKHELGSFYRFIAGKYGPFSRGLIKDLEELQDIGFIKMEGKPVHLNEFNEEEKYIYNYELTPKGKNVVKEVLDNLPINAVHRLRNLETFNKIPLQELLKYIYKKYPNYIKKSLIMERILQD